MASTVFGSFSNSNQAQTAVSDLLASGIRPEEISILLGSGQTPSTTPRNAPPQFEMDAPLGNSVPIAFSGTNGTGNRLDPFDNSMHEVATRIEGDAENNSNLDSVLNPAQDDYPRTGSASPTEFSSAPPDAERDYNPSLETQDYAKGYSADVDRELQRDEIADRARANSAGLNSDNGTTPEDTPEAFRNRMHVGTPRPDAVQNAPLISTSDRPGMDITGQPATPNLGALTTTQIPGVGTVGGGGPLATTLCRSGTPETLSTQLAVAGLPDDRARSYTDQVSGGGALVAVTVPDDASSPEVLDTLRRNGATRAETTSPVAS